MSLRLSPEEYKALITAVFERDLWRCRNCGFRRLHAHHIVFRSEGGEDIRSNLVSLCPCCHDAVHSGRLSIWSEDQALGADGELQFTALQGWRPS